MKRTLRCTDGYTFVELLVVSAIVIILASAVMPLARVTATRQREMELRRTLREMRTAIDRYKDAADLGAISPLELKAGAEGYPPDLQTLVDGVPAANDATGASGTGLLGALLFDAVAPGSATLTLSGAATGPGGTPMGLQFRPVTVSVQP